MNRLVRDTWLEEVMERPVYKVVICEQPKNLFLGKKKVNSFYYIKIPTDKIDIISELTSLGFYLVDTNVTFELKLERRNNSYNFIRRATGDDKLSVKCLAQKSFNFSRFHLDPKITNELANKIKSQWAINYFYGRRGDEMFVAEINGKIVGFLQLLKLKENSYVIDLIAVDQELRGQGTGRNLIYAAQNVLGASMLRVGTQITNISSIRFYERIGFSIVDSNYILHLHL